MQPTLATPRRALVLALGLFLAACGGAPELAEVSDGADSTAAAQASSPPHAPKATVVLLHGMGGFTRLGFDYFYEVPAAWRAAGARVYVPGTTALASIEQRAAELKAQLDRVDGPLILVGHSQGGLDGRYLVSKLGYGWRTRALVTIASPHHGSPVADVALGLAPGPVEDAADTLLHVLGWSLDGAREVTVAYMDGTFNREVLDVPGVVYWSFSGLAAPFGLGRGNGWLHAPLWASWALLDVEHLPSDGVVPEASAHWGVFQGALPADHLGEVGQPLGATPGFGHARFFRELLQRFHDQGW